MNLTIIKVAALGLLGVALLPAEIEVANIATAHLRALADSRQVAAVQRATHILAGTVADEARTVARGAAFDVALHAVRGASALYAATVSGLPGHTALPGVQVIEKHRTKGCPNAHTKSCSTQRTVLRIRTLETS